MKIQIKHMMPLAVIASLFFLNGCNNKKENKKEEKKETFKTVKYYDTHIKAREIRRKECDSMEEMTKTIMIDCKNAQTSYNNENIGKLQDKSSWF